VHNGRDAQWMPKSACGGEVELEADTYLNNRADDVVSDLTKDRSAGHGGVVGPDHAVNVVE
jgi:hypothetical protein